MVDGITYWVVPSINGGQLSARCAALARQRLRDELPKVPVSLRPVVWSLGEQRIARLGPHESVTLVEQGPNVGSGFGGEDIYDIEHRGVFGSDTTPHGARLAGLLPDGVSTVQISYPATGSRAAFSTTAAVVDNVMVANLPGSVRGVFADRMIWRAANGVIIRTVLGY